MKKVVLASLLLVVGPLVALAQPHLSNNPQSSPRFRANSADNQGVGIKGGVNFCNIRGDGAGKLYHDTQAKTLFHVGVYAQIGITNRLSLQPELLYQRKGYVVKGDTSTTFQKGTTNDSLVTVRNYTTKLSYLTLPVLLVYTVAPHVSVQVGPQISYLTNVREGSKVVVPATHKYNAVDVSVVGGIEGKFEFLRAGIRYDYSLTDVRKDATFVINDVQSKARSDFKSGVFQVYLGVGL